MNTSSPKSQPCIFCDILQGKNNQKPLYEDELCFAFDDISKDSAREHILVCPREHIKNVNSLNSSHTELLIHMKKVAEDLLNKIDSKAEKRYGFHVPPFYSIKHLHLHIVMGPINSFFHRNVTFGGFLRRIDTQIKMVKAKPPKL